MLRAMSAWCSTDPDRYLQEQEKEVQIRARLAAGPEHAAPFIAPTDGSSGLRLGPAE